MLNIANRQRNANQNHNEISPHLSEYLLSKIKSITSVGEDIEKRKPTCTVDRNVNWHNHYGKQYIDFSKY